MSFQAADRSETFLMNGFRSFFCFLGLAFVDLSAGDKAF